MTQEISDQTPFLPTDAYRQKLFSSRAEFGPSNNSNLQNLLSPVYLFSEFPSCKLIKSLNFNEETFRQINSHQQPSPFTWATSFPISDQNLLYAIFVPFGLIIWNNYTQKSRFYDIKPVEKRKAVFINCQVSISLIFSYEGDTSIYAIHNIQELDDENQNEVQSLDLQQQIVFFGPSRPELALIITKSEAVQIHVPSLTKQNSFALAFMKKHMPFRQTHISDALLFTTVMNEVQGEIQESIVALSSKNLSIFQLDETATNFVLINSITILNGNPLFISIIQNTAFVILDDPQLKYKCLRIDDIYSSQSNIEEIYIKSNDEIISLIAIEPNVCCVLTKYHIQFYIVNEADSMFSLLLSKSSDDYILTGCLSSDHALSILTASEGDNIIEIDPLEQLITCLPYQINCIAHSLKILETTSDEPDFGDYIAFLEKVSPSNEAFLTLDKRFTSFTSHQPIKSQLELHLKLVSLFNLYKEQHHEDDLEDGIYDELEIDAYNLICLKVTEKYFDKMQSFEFDEIKNAARQQDLSTIFEFIHNDISTHKFYLLPLLTELISNCYEKHYKPNEGIYRSEVKCHPELIRLLDESLSELASPEEYIKIYSKLCLFSFILLNDKEKSIHYTMNLFNARQASIEMIESIALEFEAYELLAEILHNCDRSVERSLFYYNHFNGNIRPILQYMIEHKWIWDILQLGEISEYKNDVTDLLSQSDSLTLAFHYITEDCADMDKAATLLWEVSLKCMNENIFTLDESASFLSLAMMSCSLVIPENPTPESQHFIDLYELIRNKFILLEYQKKLLTKNQTGAPVYVMKSDDIIEAFLEKKDPILSLSALSLSFLERKDSQNGNFLARIMSLYAPELEDKLTTPIKNLPQYQIIVDSQLPRVPRNFKSQIEKYVENSAVQELIINIVSQAVHFAHSQPK